MAWRLISTAGFAIRNLAEAEDIKEMSGLWPKEIPSCVMITGGNIYKGR